MKHTGYLCMYLYNSIYLWCFSSFLKVLKLQHLFEFFYVIFIKHFHGFKASKVRFPRSSFSRMSGSTTDNNNIIGSYSGFWNTGSRFMCCCCCRPYHQYNLIQSSIKPSSSHQWARYTRYIDSQLILIF